MLGQVNGQNSAAVEIAAFEPSMANLLTCCRQFTSVMLLKSFILSALTLLVERQEGRLVWKKMGVGLLMVIF